MPNEFNPDLAADALRAADGIGNPAVRSATVAELGVAALIDIAASLQILAAEAYLAMPRVEQPVEPEPVDDATRDFLVVGDLVTLRGDSEPGEVTRVGVDQGEAFAVVSFANGHEDRYYARNLTRLVGDDAADGEIAGAIDASLDALYDFAVNIDPDDAPAVDDDVVQAAVDRLDALKTLADKTPAPKKGKRA